MVGMARELTPLSPADWRLEALWCPGLARDVGWVVTARAAATLAPAALQRRDLWPLPGMLTDTGDRGDTEGTAREITGIVEANTEDVTEETTKGVAKGEGKDVHEESTDLEGVQKGNTETVAKENTEGNTPGNTEDGTAKVAHGEVGGITKGNTEADAKRDTEGVTKGNTEVVIKGNTEATIKEEVLEEDRAEKSSFLGNLNSRTFKES